MNLKQNCTYKAFTFFSAWKSPMINCARSLVPSLFLQRKLSVYTDRTLTIP